MQNQPHENRVYVRKFSFERKYARISIKLQGVDFQGTNKTILELRESGLNSRMKPMKKCIFRILYIPRGEMFTKIQGKGSVIGSESHSLTDPSGSEGHLP